MTSTTTDISTSSQGYPSTGTGRAMHAGQESAIGRRNYIRGWTLLTGYTRPECFPETFGTSYFSIDKISDPLFSLYKFQTPYFFLQKFQTPCFSLQLVSFSQRVEFSQLAKYLCLSMTRQSYLSQETLNTSNNYNDYDVRSHRQPGFEFEGLIILK